ncbi:phage tail protein, partial [Escherichia coli]|uniref:phage tail protein n=1 Tax=Escherichia coli TaxID=562 RepID=UPI0016565F19
HRALSEHKTLSISWSHYPQTVDFSVGAEGLRHVPGDVIEICDDDYAGIRTGGRVLAVNSQTRTLTLDREITLPSSG